MVDDQIKRECDKNHFIEEEIKVISKEEDQEIKSKYRNIKKISLVWKKKSRDIQKK